MRNHDEFITIKRDELRYLGAYEPPPSKGYAHNAAYYELYKDGERIGLTDGLHITAAGDIRVTLIGVTTAGR
jgi:hypothetical protein